MKYLFIDMEYGEGVVQSSDPPTVEQVAQSIDASLIILSVQGDNVEKLDAIDENDQDSWSPVENYYVPAGVGEDRDESPTDS
jgi:hypothetical protein